MTTRNVSFALYRADLVTPSRGSILATPTRRHNSGTMTVLPTPVQIPINGVTVHALEVPGTDWCWQFVERVNGGTTRYCTFAAGSDVNYTDLVDIDPVTLAPSVPTASWSAALAAEVVRATAAEAAAALSGGVTSVATRTGAVTLVKADVGLSAVDNTADTAKPVSTLQAASIATKGAWLPVAAAVTASGALVTGHNPVDATAGNLTMTLPTGRAAGTIIVVEKADNTTNTVTVSGNIRGVGASTLVLALAKESIEFLADAAGSWWPIAGHKTLSSLDARTATAVKAHAGSLNLLDFLPGGSNTLGNVDYSSYMQAACDAVPATGGAVYIPASINGGCIGFGSTVIPKANTRIYSDHYWGMRIVKLADVPLFDLSGTPTGGGSVSANQKLRITIEQLTLAGAQGDSGGTGAGGYTGAMKATWTQPLVLCHYSQFANFIKVWFRSNYGRAIYGVKWWDCELNSCRFDNLGDNTATCWAVHAARQGQGSVSGDYLFADDNSNNVNFTGQTVFEQNRAGGFYIDGRRADGTVVPGDPQPNRFNIGALKMETASVPLVAPLIQIDYAKIVRFPDQLDLVLAATGLNLDALINLNYVSDINLGAVDFQSIDYSGIGSTAGYKSIVKLRNCNTVRLGTLTGYIDSTNKPTVGSIDMDSSNQFVLPGSYSYLANTGGAPLAGSISSGAVMDSTHIGSGMKVHAPTAATELGAPIRRIPMKDSVGNLLGYTPIYDVLDTFVLRLACFGDSLTFGGFGTTAASDLGVTGSNQGVSGQASSDVALRQGGLTVGFQVAGNSIPATTTGVALTLVSPSTGWMLQGGQTFTFPGSLAGVPGSLVHDTTALTWTFTRTTAGSAVAIVARPAVFVCSNGPGFDTWAQTIWVGRNNVTSGTPITDVARDIALMVANIKSATRRFLVMGITNAYDEPAGTANLATIQGHNTLMAALYPGRFFDVRVFLRDECLALAGLTPTTQDTTDIANDLIPSQLKVDNVHFTAAAQTQIGHRVALLLSQMPANAVNTSALNIAANAASVLADTAPTPVTWRSGRYYFLNPSPVVSVSTLTNGTVRATPFWVPGPTSIVRLGAEVVTAGDSGCKFRIGIYKDDGTGRPGALLLDAGVIAGDSATVQEITVAQTLYKGWYWQAGAVQGATTTQPTVRMISAPAPFMDAGTSIPGAGSTPASVVSPTGIPTLGTALPAAFGAAASVSTSGVRCFIKVA